MALDLKKFRGESKSFLEFLKEEAERCKKSVAERDAAGLPRDTKERKKLMRPGVFPSIKDKPHNIEEPASVAPAGSDIPITDSEEVGTW